MYLSQTAEYALRAMTHLALHATGDEGVRAADLSEEISVPLPYLQKILRRLVVAGLLESKKGHGGGFRLLVPPSRIPFSEVLGVADWHVGPGHCAFGWSNCDPAHPCPLHPAWSRLTEAITAWAETTTLADVLDSHATPRRKKRK